MHADGVLRGGARVRPHRGHRAAPSPPTRWPPPSRRRWRCKETGEEKVILTALCGHGLLDLAAYGNYQAGQVTDFDLPAEAVEDALRRLPAGV